jgi:hypothetical protein
VTNSITVIYPIGARWHGVRWSAVVDEVLGHEVSDALELTVVDRVEGARVARSCGQLGEEPAAGRGRRGSDRPDPRRSASIQVSALRPR